MHTMYFNTGVLPHNRPGQLGEFESWRGGTLHKEYHLERAPLPGWTISFLCGPEYLEQLRPFETAIKIVGGGMLSEYAIFNTHNK